jgi:acyl-CoA synthetase (AMP-forming)/AMP-acid ligase II
MRFGVATFPMVDTYIPANLAIDAILTDRPPQFPGAKNVIPLDASWLQSDVVAPENGQQGLGGDAPSRIDLALGGDGHRWPVALTQGLLAARLAHLRISRGSLLARAARTFSTFPVASSQGFTDMMYALTQGATIYFPGRDPLAILQYIAPYGVQAMVTSPDGLDALLPIFEGDDALESRFEVILCRGPGLPRDLADRARTRLCANLIVCYEPTEASVVACGAVQAMDSISGAVGYVCPGVRVEAVNDHGVPLPAGGEGRIRIRSPYLVSGYLGDTHESARAFSDGVFCPGVVGHVTASGVLAVTARPGLAVAGPEPTPMEAP